MPITPEDRARENIDKLLSDAGWVVQDKRATNLSAGRGVSVREFPLKPGHGEADYLLFVDGAPVGVVEAKKEGDTLDFESNPFIFQTSHFVGFASTCGKSCVAIRAVL